MSNASVFAALGDTTRLELLSRLGDGKPHSIVQLTGGLALTRQGVTKHLEVLRQAGLVSCKRIGRENRFTLRPGPIAKARDYLARATAPSTVQAPAVHASSRSSKLENPLRR